MFKNLGFVFIEIMYKSWKMPNRELADIVLMELKNDNYRQEIGVDKKQLRSGF